MELIAETLGSGAPVERGAWYDARLRIWLSRGDPVLWQCSWWHRNRGRIEDGGQTLFMTLRVNRMHLFDGLFYGLQGMRVGGRRKLRVAPHLAYGEAGVEGFIPANALLTVEIEIVAPGQP